MKKRKEKKRHPIKILPWTARVYTLTIILLILVSTWAVYHFVYADMKRTAEETISLKLDSTARLLNGILDDTDRCFEITAGVNGSMLKMTDASDSPLYHFVSEYKELSFGDKEAVQAVKELKILNESLAKIFADGLGLERSDYRIAIYLDDQLAVSRYMSDGTSVDGDGIYKAAMTEENPVYSALCEAGEGKSCFCIQNGSGKEQTEKLYFGQMLNCNVAESQWKVQKQCLGYMVCEFRKEMIEELLGGTEYESISACVLDKNGKIWASHKGFREIGKGEWKESTKSGVFVKKNSLSNGMQLIMMMPQSVIRGPIVKNVAILLLVFGILLVALICMLFLFNWYLIVPVVRLAEHMEKGELLKIEENHSVNSTREVQILYRGFNRFIEQSREYIEDIYRIEKEKRKMEYRMLQAQINPHFLYNTLDSVGCLALLKGQSEIADLLKSLARIMRYSIHDPQKTVSLHEELSIVKEYEKLQQSCYGKRLEFFYDLEKDVEELQIPKMLIQPLVENAIFHGIKPENGMVVVEISAEKKDGFVQITVWDNGTGLNYEEVQRYLNGERRSNEKAGGLGIYNIRMRLKNLYGEKAELILQQDENGCTEVLIQIPCEKEE